MTMKTEGLNERAPECFVELARADAEAHGLAHGERATVSSRRGSIEVVVQVSDKATPGTVFLPLPLCPGGGQPAHQRPARPDLGHPGVQGLRREALQGGLRTRRTAPERPAAMMYLLRAVLFFKIVALPKGAYPHLPPPAVRAKPALNAAAEANL